MSETPESPDKDSVFGKIFHWFMVAFCLAIIFALSGAFTYLKFGGDRINETAAEALIKFIIGGILGVAATLGIYFGKNRDLI